MTTPKPMFFHPSGARTLALSAVLVGLLAGLQGCAPVPLLAGGMVGGAIVVADRRTTGIVVEDNTIEVKAGANVRETLGDRAHVNVTSYNRQVLITGEVANDRDRQLAEKAVASVENVKGVVNELAIAGLSSFSQRSNDALVTSRVKAAMLDSKDIQANAIKVVTERGTVYLLGRVTQREANRATEVVRSTNGVLKVVRVLEIISEEELARMTPPPAPPKDPEKGR